MPNRLSIMSERKIIHLISEEAIWGVWFQRTAWFGRWAWIDCWEGGPMPWRLPLICQKWWRTTAQRLLRRYGRIHNISDSKILRTQGIRPFSLFSGGRCQRPVDRQIWDCQIPGQEPSAAGWTSPDYGTLCGTNPSGVFRCVSSPDLYTAGLYSALLDFG